MMLYSKVYISDDRYNKKMEGAPWSWGQTLNQLCIYFGDRITPADLE